MRPTLFFFALFTSTLGLPPEEEEKLKEVSEICLQIHPVATEILGDLVFGKVHEDPALQDYLHCVFVAMKYADGNGNLLLTPRESRKFIGDGVPDEKKDAIIGACNALTSAYAKRRVFLIYRCYVSHLHPHYVTGGEDEEELDERPWGTCWPPIRIICRRLNYLT